MSDFLEGRPDVSAAEPTDMTMQTATEVEVVQQSALRRNVLNETMDPEHYEMIVGATKDLIERRFQSMQMLNDVAKPGVNINPFLMLAMAPAYNIFSPFEAAEYLQYAKMPHGDSTAFGKFVEDKIFPIFGVSVPPEKKLDKQTYSPIDAEITVDGVRYLTTWKSGPWTMNQSHANEMSSQFPRIHQSTGSPIILGIFYGKLLQLNNKPAIVRRSTGEYFHVLVGKDLWEFVTGVKDAHLRVLEAIRDAQTRFSIEHGGKTFYEHMIESRLQLSESFRNAFQLTGENDDMWEKIFKESF